jgi:hypothetical protein
MWKLPLVLLLFIGDVITFRAGGFGFSNFNDETVINKRVKVHASDGDKLIAWGADTGANNLKHRFS